MYIIPDILWDRISKLIPEKESKIGRPPMCPRKALNAILFIIKTGIQWHCLPREMGATSTVHGKFRHWVKLGIFSNIMGMAVDYYKAHHGEGDGWHASDTSSSKAPFASSWAGKNPTDRGKQGIKKSIIVDRNGAPLALSIGAANAHDSQFFNDTLDALKNYNYNDWKIMACDSAYDSKKIKDICFDKNFILLASENKRNSKGNQKPYKPPHRWVVERTFGWLNWNRGIKFCWTKLQSSFLAFCHLACSIQLFKMSGVSV